MTYLRLLVVIGLASCLALLSPKAHAAQAYGTVVFKITGTFKTPVSKEATAQCTGILDLLPNVSGSTSLSSLTIGHLLQMGEQNAVATGVILSPTSFSCVVTVPYRWDNFSASQQMAISYTVIAHDPGVFNPVTGVQVGSRPGKSRQIVETIAVPADGTTTTVTVDVSL